MRGVSGFQEQAVTQRGGKRRERSLCSHGTAAGRGRGEEGEEEKRREDGGVEEEHGVTRQEGKRRDAEETVKEGIMEKDERKYLNLTMIFSVDVFLLSRSFLCNCWNTCAFKMEV